LAFDDTKVIKKENLEAVYENLYYWSSVTSRCCHSEALPLALSRFATKSMRELNVLRASWRSQPMKICLPGNFVVLSFLALTTGGAFADATANVNLCGGVTITSAPITSFSTCYLRFNSTIKRRKLCLLI
jgi:hypothetical protein